MARWKRNIQKPHQKGPLTTPFGRFVERRTYLGLLGIATFVVLLSMVYFAEAPNGHGLYRSANPVPGDISSVGYWDALYFAVLSFTTVGYGDYVPLGLGRLVAMLDAFTGLAFAALVIGKIASERQYAMLLLLHTSDCQRRLEEFGWDIEDARAVLKKATQQGQVAALKSEMKNAHARLNAVRNYVVFHLNQSRLGAFGNHAALRTLCEELYALQKAVSDSFKALPSNKVLGDRCLSLSEQIYKLVETIELHATQEGGVASRGHYLNSTKTEFKELHLWAHSPSNDWLLDQVIAIKPPGTLNTWPRHSHKIIATSIGISNQTAQRCIDELKARGLV